MQKSITFKNNRYYDFKDAIQLTKSGSNLNLLYYSSSIYPTTLFQFSSSGVMFGTASYALNAGAGTVGPGQQNYIAFFSGSTTTISSSVAYYDSVSGSIGIGTTTPSASMEFFGKQLLIRNNIDHVTGSGIRFLRWPTPSCDYVVAPEVGGLSFYSTAQDTNYYEVMKLGGTGDPNPPKLVYQDSILGNGRYSKWVLNPSGNIDYSTTFAIREYAGAHNYALGVFTTLNSQSFGVKPNGDGYFTGSVGIGTSSPQHLLDVMGSNISTIRFSNANTLTDIFFLKLASGGGSSEAYLKGQGILSSWHCNPQGTTVNGLFTTQSAISTGIITGPGSAAFVLGTNAVERMRISSDGDVGIRLTNPLARLDVSASLNGSIRISGLDNGGSWNKLLTITGSGGEVFNFNAGGSETKLSLKQNGTGATSTWDFITANGTNLNGGSNINSIISKEYADLVLSQYSALHIKQTGHPVDNKILLKVVDSSNDTKLIISSSNVGIGTSSPTYKLDVSGSSNSIGRMRGSGSANPIFIVEGSLGELFSVTDNLSGSLFSVNDISGVPVLEVFSDNTTLLGSYAAPALHTTVKKIIGTGTGTVIYQVPTASYDGIFAEYTIKSGSVARVGNVMTTWTGSGGTTWVETSASIGDTSAFNFYSIITGGNFALTGSATTAGWTVKTIIRSI